MNSKGTNATVEGETRSITSAQSSTSSPDPSQSCSNISMKMLSKSPSTGEKATSNGISWNLSQSAASRSPASSKESRDPSKSPSELSHEKSKLSQDLSISNHPREKSNRPNKKRTVDPRSLSNVLTPSEDIDSLPDLVDDSIIREKLEGFRGGRRWNILEDTPGGHADDNFHIVEAIEFDEASADFVLEDSEVLEEDDDIIEDQEEESLILQRARRRNSLPADPRSAHETLQGTDSSKPLSRFHPAFKDHERWKEAVAGFDPENVESASVPSDSAFEDNLEKYALTPEEQVYDDMGNCAARTPATTKRSGGRRLKEMSVPNLDGDSESCDSMSLGKAPLDPTLKDKCGDTQRALSTRQLSNGLHQQPKGSCSTGRSSGRHSSTRPHRDRGRKGKRIPDVVPATPAVDGVARSPMSSSLTSTPNAHSLSMASSIQTSEHQRSVQALRRLHSTRDSSSKRESKTSLIFHVGRGRDMSPAPDSDDFTLGASTITSNNSTTQRTTGENTLSTRSLFQSERMSISENPMKPMRRRADSESEVDSAFYADTCQSPNQSRRSEEAFAKLEDPFQTKLHLSDSDISHSEELRQIRPDNESIVPLKDIKSHAFNNSYTSSMWSANCSILTGGANSVSDYERNNQSLDRNSLATPESTSSRREEIRPLSNSDDHGKQFNDKNRESSSDEFLSSNNGGFSLEVDANSSSDLGRDKPAGKHQVTSENQRTDISSDSFNESLVDSWNKTALLHAKKKKYGLFRRAKSWKGVVALRNEDEP